VRDGKHLALVAIFLVTSVFEIAVTALVFFAPATAAAQLHVADTPDTRRLGFFVGWLMVLFSAACCLTTWQLVRRDPNGRVLAAIFGCLFVAMGIAFFVQYGEPDLLLMDTLRGAAILALLPSRHPQRGAA
jgi:DMSO reductase anchor subunit